MKNLKLPHMIIGGFVLLVIVIVIIAAVVMQSNRVAEESDQRATGTTSETDPVSGLEVTEDADRNHDTYGIDIAFIGFSRLVDRGVSMEQVTIVQDKLEELSDQLPEPIERVSLYQDSIERILPAQSGTDYHLVRFKVQVNQKDDYNVGLRYQGISDADVTVTDSDGKKYDL